MNHSIKVLLLTICSTLIASRHSDIRNELDLCAQNITSITQKSQILQIASFSVVHLNLCNNNLVDIEKNLFEGFKSLERLILDGNRRLKFNPNGSEFLVLESLTDLECGRCGVDKIHNGSLQGMPHLEVFNLIENKIERIEASAFHANTNLKKIDLRMNKLKRLPNTMLISLLRIQWIKLSKNRELGPEGSEPFLISKMLEELWCDECGFVVIQKSTFAKLPGLKQLYLRGNKISHIHGLAFSLMPLRKLMLQGNLLKNIDPRLLNVTNVCLNNNSDELIRFLKDLSDHERFICSNSSTKDFTSTTIWISTTSSIDITTAEGRMANHSEIYTKSETQTKSVQSTSSSASVTKITLISLTLIIVSVLLVGVWLKLKKRNSAQDGVSGSRETLIVWLPAFGKTQNLIIHA